jgi:UDP-galactopyranose mutase
MNRTYDYLIIGAGLTGAVIAHELHKKGKSVLVVDKRNHIGGNCYTDNSTSVMIHQYGAHIFHTDKK